MKNTSIFSQLIPTARVWIYQANEPFAVGDISDISTHLEGFAKKWVSHSQQLKAGAQILHQRFIVLMVDESQAGASGCSIDSSVAFIKELGAKYNRDLLDRMRFSYMDEKENVHTVSKDEFVSLYQNGTINDQTIVFDPLVNTVGDMEKGFMKKLGNSWHSRFV